jgi:hypothetical protein
MSCGAQASEKVYAGIDITSSLPLQVRLCATKLGRVSDQLIFPFMRFSSVLGVCPLVTASTLRLVRRSIGGR